MASGESGKFQFAIDRGGTFTDVFCKCPNGDVKTLKLLSEDPKNYRDAPTEGIRRILQQVTGKATLADGSVDSSLIEWIRMGTTVATNALLERKGQRMALIVNKGFKDLLFIGNQARPSIFQLAIQKPEMLYSEVIEVDCRVVPALRDKCSLDADALKWKSVVGTTGEELYIVKELDREQVKKDLQEMRSRTGIDSVAVLLAHSYTYHQHELAVGEIAQQIGFSQVSLSHQVMAMVRAVPRGLTACVDAYLTPHIKRYLHSFSQGFSDKLHNTNVLFMQSDGGLTPMESFIGSRAILSGPAGGVVGYAYTTYHRETDLPVIGFDMGGTSTDVSRYAGALEHVHEATTAGVVIQAPQLDVNTVAAGGGSILNFRSGLFVVGPESCGARPGPACYGANGPAAVTDANLVLGRLLPKYFPKIFGPKEDQPLCVAASLVEMEKLRGKVNTFMMETRGHQMSLEEAALGFIEVANEAMCRPIRALTTARGYDTSHHVLACFGGAGGQHACSIARSLGIRTVFVHKYAGILSAYGMALADVVHEAQVPCALEYTTDNFQKLLVIIDSLSKTCVEKLTSQGFDASHISLEGHLHMRYEGTDCALMCSSPTSATVKPTYQDFMTKFLSRYQSEFGFTIEGRTVFVDDVRVRGSARCHSTDEKSIPSADTPEPTPSEVVEVYFEGGHQPTSVFKLDQLRYGHQIKGPAIIMDNLSTILVEPDCNAAITQRGDVKINVGSGAVKRVGTELDSIQLSIFSHRFMSIAEQMGRILQRTSISVNIKERLDFSCALFGPDGGLVSNAPHIPVHLGAMQETVKYQIEVRGGTLQEGDVILSNHPKAGGSHLPDLTVITPVFHKGVSHPIFFVASRGHHADIGGITPGSMPPHSTSLAQEGAAFLSFLLVHKGIFREEELKHELRESRNLADNLSDLKAQIAANRRGVQLVGELISCYSLEVVQAYMAHIQTNAEVAVRDMLKNIARNIFAKTGSYILKGVEHMDDGTPIQLTVTLDPSSGSADCDFTGTGVEVWGNCNAPRAITLSAMIYCLRCMVGHDVPLNQGCLAPVKLTIPQGSILDPSEEAAVVGGNVLTSQRIVDVVLKAFQVCAASQGCMNNVTLGSDQWGYYETVAGGSGAGPGWNGSSGVHTHMTNTRITDLEIIERRYPLILEEFSIRQGSGGRGKWMGGDGITRKIMFRSPITLSVLSERRAFAPYGMNRGSPGARGGNYLKRKCGKMISLGGKTSVNVEPGDTFILLTPGGGGYGAPEDSHAEEALSGELSTSAPFTLRGSVHEYQAAQESV